MIKHDSMRGWFAYELYQYMSEDKDIYCIVGDLGYGVFDKIRDDFPDRFINTGAAETAMMDIAVGLAMSGKIPVVYSITTFLLYRPFEVIRNYINHEGWSVKMVGSGRGRDYKHDGWSHDASDVKRYLRPMLTICQDWPEEKEDISSLMDEFLYDKKPHFLSLRR